MHARLHRRLGRIARVTFSGLMIIAWTGALRPPVAIAAPDASDLQQQRARHAELLKRLCDLGEEELNRPGADPSDIAGKTKALESDPQKIFTFVRHEIAFEPYRGVLRGARGTLAAGAGNAYDKSLLLQEMLKASGHTAHLVKGRLPSDKAKSLVQQFLQRNALAGPLGAFAPAKEGPTTAADYVITRAAADAPELQKIVADARAATDALLTQASEMTGREAGYLQEQLTKTNVTIGRPLEAWSKELEARAADHVWVEWETGDGTMTALDSCFADAEPGKAVGLSGRPISDTQLASARHTVRFQLTYRHENGSAVKTVSLLDVTLPADRGLFDAVEFSIVPADELPPVAELAAMGQEESIKFWTSFKSYQPVLSVGTKRHLGRAFDLKGGVFSAGAGGQMKGLGGLGRAAGGLFAEKDSEGSGKPGGTFVDLAVLVTVQSPGDKPVQHQRILVAKADVTGEHFLSPILAWQMLVQPQVVSADLAGNAALQHKLAALKPIVPLLTRDDFGDAVLNRIRSSPPAPAYPALLMDLAMLRQVGLARAAADTQAAIPLWDRPQVTVAERRFCAMRDGSHACGRFATDVMTNRMSFVPREAGAEPGAAAAAIALRQGVLDTALESLVVERASSGNGAYAAAITDSERVRASGGSFAVVAPRDAAKPSAGVALSPDDAAWVARYEPESNRIIAPSAAVTAVPNGDAAAVPSVWWSLDPQTGSVLGRRDGGRGQAMTEYEMQLVLMDACLIFALAGSAISGVETRGDRAGLAIAGLGCIAGGAAGAGAVGLTGSSAQAATIIAALIDGVFQLLGAYAGRDD